MVHSDGMPWTDAELEQEITSVLDSLMDHLPSGAPGFRFRGQSVGGQWHLAYIPGAVHIVPWGEDDCNQQEGCSCQATGQVRWDNGQDPDEGFLLLLKRSGIYYSGGVVFPDSVDCDITWDTYQPTYSSESRIKHLRAALNHEFMHVLGSKHYGDVECPDCVCAADPCSLTDIEGRSHRLVNPFRWDWENMTSKYGPFPSTVSYRDHRISTSSGVSWGDGNESTLSSSAPLFAAASAVTSAYLSYATRSVSTLVPTLRRYDPSTSTWSSWGAPVGIAGSPGQVGVADKGSGSSWRGYLGWLSGESLESSIEVPKVAMRHPTSGWGTPFAFLSYPTQAQGISIALDPRYSDAIVMAYRSSTSRVVLQVANSTTGSIGNQIDVGGYSADPPMVTCGPSTLTYNCLVTWANLPVPGGKITLKWRHFRVSVLSGAYVFFDTDLQPVQENLFEYLYSSPSVAYKGGSQCPFLFTWKGHASNGDGKWYTQCKGTSATAGLTAGTKTEHMWTGNPVSPRVGAAASQYHLFNYRTQP